MGGRASHAGSQHQISLQHGDGDAGEDILNILLYQFLQVSIQKRLQPDWKISTSLIKSPALAKKKSSTEHSQSHSGSKVFCDDCEGEVSTSEQDKASLKEEVKVFKYKY